MTDYEYFNAFFNCLIPLDNTLNKFGKTNLMTTNTNYFAIIHLDCMRKRLEVRWFATPASNDYDLVMLTVKRLVDKHQIKKLVHVSQFEKL